MAAVEAGIEACHLGNVRHPFEDRFDRCKVVRLVKWCERRECFQLSQNLAGHDNRLVELRAAVDDPMTDAGNSAAVTLRTKPMRKNINRRAAISDRGVQFFIRELLAGIVLDGQPRRCANALDLAARSNVP